MKTEIEKAIAVLVGRALWTCRRAADMAMFHFGDRSDTDTIHGTPAEVGEIALHVQCAWRIARENEVVVGRQDLYYPADYENEREDIPKDFDWDRDPNRHDKLLRVLFEDGARKFVVQKVEVGEAGRLHIELSDSLSLDVLPFNSLPGEHWRLFSPVKEDQRHFVVTGRGIES